MRVEVHIERLVLDGIAVTPGQSDALREALARELVCLLETGGLDRGLASGGSRPRLAAGRLETSDHFTSVELGRGIARAAHEGMGGRSAAGAADRAGVRA